MYVTREMEVGHPKCLQMCTGEGGIMLYGYALTISLFMFLSYGILLYF